MQYGSPRDTDAALAFTNQILARDQAANPSGSDTLSG